MAHSFYSGPHLCLTAGSGVIPSSTAPVVPSVSGTLSNPSVAMVSIRPANALDEILKLTPPALAAFIASLPAVEGNIPCVSFRIDFRYYGVVWL